MSLLETHSQKAHNVIASRYGFGCGDYSPDRCFNTDRGFLLHLYIMLDPLMDVKYNEGMASKKLPPDIKDYFVKMGRTGGKLGGRIRADRLSQKRRSEIARKASEARWGKKG